MVSALWDRLVADINFLEMAREESKRTIYCEPHRVEQVRAAIEARGAGDILTAVANPACPEGQLLIVDEGAFAAAAEQSRQSLLRELQRQPWRLGGASDAPGTVG